MMEEPEVCRLETEPVKDIEVRLEGRIFHVTKRDYWPLIVQAGAILPNTDGRLPTTFGSGSNSYFRNRGCVSVFDFREPPTVETEDFRYRCSPLRAAQPGDPGIAILMLDPAIASRLVLWECWKNEEAWGEMVVPHIEAGHPGPIPLQDIERVIFFRRTEDPQSLAAMLRASRCREKG